MAAKFHHTATTTKIKKKKKITEKKVPTVSRARSDFPLSHTTSPITDSTD